MEIPTPVRTPLPTLVLTPIPAPVQTSITRHGELPGNGKRHNVSACERGQAWGEEQWVEHWKDIEALEQGLVLHHFVLRRRRDQFSFTPPSTILFTAGGSVYQQRERRWACFNG